LAGLETFILTQMQGQGAVISARHLGMNLAQGYERFGSLPWEKFDEVQAQIGASLLRFPGGTEAETLFDYAHPQATSALNAAGQVVALTTPAAFLAYCASTGSRATFVLATKQLLTAAPYGSRDFDASKTELVRAYVAYLLETAGPEGIATFELGNEYAAYMNGVEYGRVASALALIVDQEIDRFLAAHPASTRPDIAVQVWTVNAAETLSLADLAARNANVMAEFSGEELAAVTATTTHFYYTQGKFAGQINAHDYDNIGQAIGLATDLMHSWDRATGRALDQVFSEWNVHFRDAQSFGLQQVPVLLELFSALVTEGVDEMDIWSTLYNASALADYRGRLQASGALMEIMAKEVTGMRVADLPVASAHYDLHGFTGATGSYLFVSSLSDAPQSLSLDLSNYLQRNELVSARVIGVDARGADGIYKDYTGLQPWEEPDLATSVTGQDLGLWYRGGAYLAELAPHETLVLAFERVPLRLGSAAPDLLNGRLGQADRIDAMASDDQIWGRDGDDTLFGGEGNDILRGGLGADRLWGGAGADAVLGGDGADRLEGGPGADRLEGGTGADSLSGGEGADMLIGGAGADCFILRPNDQGTDILRDYRPAEGDWLLFEGSADLSLERRVLPGVGGAAADLLLLKSGVVLAVLPDLAGLETLRIGDLNGGWQSLH
jgi:hypothetical protein